MLPYPKKSMIFQGPRCNVICCNTPKFLDRFFGDPDATLYVCCCKRDIRLSASDILLRNAIYPRDARMLWCRVNAPIFIQTTTSFSAGAALPLGSPRYCKISRGVGSGEWCLGKRSARGQAGAYSQYPTIKLDLRTGCPQHIFLGVRGAAVGVPAILQISWGVGSGERGRGERSAKEWKGTYLSWRARRVVLRQTLRARTGGSVLLVRDRS